MIYISYKFKKTTILEFVKNIDNIVKNATEKLHLEENGRGCGLDWRDWSFCDLDREKTMVDDTEKLCDEMKSYFKKWNNSYVDNDKAYKFIEKMLKMIETDENRDLL